LNDVTEVGKEVEVMVRYRSRWSTYERGLMRVVELESTEESS
jgi:hypothetical protein